MTRDDIPGVLLAVVIGAGVLWNVLGPDALGGVITVSGGLIGVAVWAGAVAAGVVGVPAWWWGPVRVSTARMRWSLVGPAHREPALGAALVRVLGVIVVSGAAVGLIVGALARSSPGVGSLGVGMSAVVGAVVAAVIVGTALLAQMRRSARLSPGGAVRPIGRWHRRVVSPVDGLAAAGTLLLMTADTEFVEHARRVRWCAGHSVSPSRAVASTSVVWSMFRADVVRLRRRPGDLLAWAAVVALTAALGLTTSVSAGAPAVLALLGYRAAGAVASGLRTVTTTPALRRSLAVSDAQMVLAHSVIPATAVVAWTVAATMTVSGVSPLAWAVIAIGVVVAALRRTTRPELPWDAPVYVTGQGGVAQPLLLLALLRGHIAVVVVAVVACLM
ncbi:DUF6297 family protein [uncultured Williamsia sp.]|uniref:DUF6297 family protein n=1 Tax=uncultured Williamsia sp. TaxID=259311 RepID=UPI002635CAAF|nr:DUF6297 family protein [uncultured Williamsia sp.]